ncbi:MAG: FHA domain-containing protein [Proteobacteria bacterium]|nr:FHA domain-containing protein [Pseudomonadota bacterium]
MSTGAIVAICVGAVLITGLVAFLITSSGSTRPKRMCGGCNRAMAPDWQKCLFCSWVPAARLEFMTGPLANQVMYLNEEVTTLGSVAGTTIVLSDPAVSRKHLAIRNMGGIYELADLGSTNGVYVNGHRTPKKTLVSGDILRVGNTEMVFRRE